MATIPASRTIPRLLEELAARAPQHEAIVSGSKRLTYSSLRDQVNQVAAALLALDVRHGDRVAILMGNRAEWLVAALAAQCIGALAVGLNTWSTPRELEFALTHSGASVLFATSGFLRQDFRAMLHTLAPLSTRVPALHHVIWSDDTDVSAFAAIEANVRQLSYAQLCSLAVAVLPEAVEQRAQRVDPADAALLVYSSGSTSQPKGIVLRHGGLIENGWHIGERQHVDAHDRLWLAVSLFWSLGSANATMNLLTHGGCIVLQDSFNATEALKLIESERCTVFYGTPNMVRSLEDASPDAARSLATLRTGATIGTPAQIERLAALGPRQICNVYGLTETYGNCAVTDADEMLAVRASTMGEPLPGFDVRIVDFVRGTPLPAGEIGEIRVKGRLFAGYFRDDARTAASFDEHGYFRSGDLGLIDAQGRIIYRGRVTEMIKTGGINVAPAEVEEILVQHPSIEVAFVVALPDDAHDEVLGAIVVARRGQSITEAALQAFCRESLAAYKVPRAFRILADHELPLTTTGKVKKSELKGLFGTLAAGAAHP